MKVFFDTSVLFSAINSATGGSAKLASLAQMKAILGITTQNIIEELEKNQYKFEEVNSEIIHGFIEKNNFLVRKSVTESEIEPCHGIIERKDAHVIAGAILTHCDYLATLDKKHINNKRVKAKIKQVIILSPKELLSIIRS